MSKSKPDRPQPKPADGELPAGWDSVPLGQLAAPTRPRREPQVWPKLPFVGMEQVESHTRRLIGTLPSAAMKSTAFHFQPGDVLYGRLRPYLNKVHCAEIEGLCSSEFIVLSPQGRLLSDYLALYLTTNEFVEFANHLNQGDRPRVSFDQIADREIPLPPLAEQKRIVAKVEELLARVNAAREGLANVPAILKHFRQSVLAAACSGRLTEDWRKQNCGDDWRETDLGEMADLVTSGSRGWASYYADSGPIFIRAQNLSSDALDLSDVAHVRLPHSGEGTRTLVAPNDILVTITGANVTKTALVTRETGEAYVNQHIALVRLRNSACAPYVWLWLVSPEHGRAQLLDAAYGAGKPGLNLKQIRGVGVRLPAPPEQLETVRRVDRLFALADSIEKQVAAGMARVEKLTQAILAKAFRGELVPTEAECVRLNGRPHQHSRRQILA